MKLYKIERKDDDVGYDNYDSAVVCAENKEAARKMHPAGWDIDYPDIDWVKPEDVIVEYIGEARAGLTSSVIVASYNAG